MIWWKVSLLLCCYGFFKEYRPSEPFISRYLRQWKNFTNEQIYQEIYPLGTYLNLPLLVVVFLLTDLLRYKPVVIAGGCSAIACWCAIRWGTTIQSMQVVEFFYAFFMASEVAYYTYIYAKVDPKHYQQVTSHTRAAFLIGKATAGLSSQLFATYSIFDYEQLNYLTIGGMAITTLCGILLPSVPTSIYFHRRTELSDEVNLGGDNKLTNMPEKSFAQKYKDAFLLLWKDFLYAYTNNYVLKWSIWWALATCGYLQVTSYAQILWEEINDSKQELLNGYVEFGYSLAGALVAFLVGYLKLPWNLVGEIFLAGISLIQGGLMVYAGYINQLIPAYVLHMAFGLLYQSAITIASSEVAKYVKEDSYALVFGINFFLALLMQTILTSVVIEALKLGIRDQFIVYGGYYLLIGAGFTIAGVLTFFNRRRGNNRSISSVDS